MRGVGDHGGGQGSQRHGRAGVIGELGSVRRAALRACWKGYASKVVKPPSCYCLEPHVPATPEQPERAWRETRATMAERLRGGTTFGYLAYVDGRPAGWVNASLRSDYGLYRLVDPDGPEPPLVIGVSCFVIAPPFRRHGIASVLLDRVIADASARGASWIEGYPHNKPERSDAGHFRGPRSMYDARGFEPIDVREHDTVKRLSADSARSPSPGG